MLSFSHSLSPHPQFTLAKHIFEAQISHPRSSFFHTKQRIRTPKKWYEFKSLAIYKRNRYSCEINILATSRFLVRLGMALKISDIFCLAATPKKGVVTLFAHRIFVHCAVADSPLLASVSLLFLPFKRIT